MSSSLGELIRALEASDQERIVPIGFSEADSWRGSYNELAFTPAPDVAVKTMLVVARSSLGRTFSGYKGGEYEMSEWTPVHLSFHGRSDDYFPLVAVADTEAVKAQMRADDEAAYLEAFPSDV